MIKKYDSILVYSLWILSEYWEKWFFNNDTREEVYKEMKEVENTQKWIVEKMGLSWEGYLWTSIANKWIAGLMTLTPVWVVWTLFFLFVFEPYIAPKIAEMYVSSKKTVEDIPWLDNLNIAADFVKKYGWEKSVKSLVTRIVKDEITSHLVILNEINSLLWDDDLNNISSERLWDIERILVSLWESNENMLVEIIMKQEKLVEILPLSLKSKLLTMFVDTVNDIEKLTEEKIWKEYIDFAKKFVKKYWDEKSVESLVTEVVSEKVDSYLSILNNLDSIISGINLEDLSDKNIEEIEKIIITLWNENIKLLAQIIEKKKELKVFLPYSMKRKVVALIKKKENLQEG